MKLLSRAGFQLAVFVPGPVAGHIAQTGGGGAGDADAGDQEHQRGKQQRPHSFLEQGEIFLIGLGGDGAGLQLRLKIAQAHQPGIAVHQEPADEEDGGNPHDHIHQIQPQKRGKPHPQHLPEQLPPVLGQVFLFKISLSALSVEIAVHQLPEHTRALQTNSDNERMIESYILHYTILCVKREINGL